jgi:PAS domain S-box-containing protein
MMNVHEESPRYAPVLICRIRPGDARIMLANDAFCTFIGRSREHVIGKSLFTIISRQDQLRVNHCLDALSRDKPFLTCEHTSKTPSGIQRLRWTHQALVNEQGEVVEIQSMGIDSDIRGKRPDGKRSSEEKPWQLDDNSNEFIMRKFEDELEQSKEKNKLIFENASDIIFIIDTNLRIIDISPRVEQVLGYRREELINKTISEMNILKPEYLAKAYTEGARVLSGEQIRSSMYEFTGREENDIVAEISGAPMMHEDRVESIICIARDITERKRIEDSLRQSEKKHRETLEQIDDGYYEVDLKGNFTFFNNSMCRILRFSPEELMGMNNRSFMGELNAHRVFCTFNQVYRTGIAAKSLDWELIRKDGSKCFVETSVSLRHDQKGTPVGFRGIARDVTEQKSLEYQLYQSQKMEAIGTLAGGIAHDFNNILSGIMGYTELALMEIPEGSPLHSKMDQVLKAGNRAKGLIKQILTISRRTEYENRPIKIKTVVEEALMMIRASLPASVEIFKTIEADDAIIEADPTLIHQIVLNLCTNAYHAVRETNGFIEVRLKQINAGDINAKQVTDPEKGGYVELTVIDTGCGISPDAMTRIFDPYYTTKPKGEGTGLGLAIVHGIVKSMGGDIKVESICGRGTSFHVCFPRLTESVPLDLKEPESIPSGREHILIIDDEQSIIEITSQMLLHLGYTVSAFQSSIDALDKFRKSSPDFDLVISDLTMPRMNGDQLAERLLLIRPDIPIIICTGFSDTIPQEMARRIGIREVLVKPFALHDLAKTIRKVLDRSRPRVEPSFNQISG